MNDLTTHLVSLIDTKRKATLLLSDAAVDAAARPLLAAEKMHDFCEPVLVGQPERIRELSINAPLCRERAAQLGKTTEEFVDYLLARTKILDPSSQQCEANRSALAGFCSEKFSREHIVSEKECKWMFEDPVLYAVAGTAGIEGTRREGHCVLGGLASTSRDFFIPTLRLHRHTGTVSMAVAFTFQNSTNPAGYAGDLLVIADVAVVADMDSRRLADVTRGTAELTFDLFCPEPLDKVNVAMLSYSTGGSGSGGSVEMVREAANLVREETRNDRTGRWERIALTEELQFGPAVSEKAAAQKLDLSDHANGAAGKANVLIAPNLDTGNVLFHLHASYFRGCKYVLLPSGFDEHSVIDFSRSSRVNDVVNAAGAACARIQKLEDFRPIEHR
ncbi:MAG: phosphate acyltransferase [Planctomycetota bacterium]|nr:phosphate acyltransferase [Planctomycetota bacterium]